MAKKQKIPDKYQVWINARKKYRLSHVHIQMARELGMNPKKFGKKSKSQARALESATAGVYREPLFQTFWEKTTG